MNKTATQRTFSLYLRNFGLNQMKNGEESSLVVVSGVAQLFLQQSLDIQFEDVVSAEQFCDICDWFTRQNHG